MKYVRLTQGLADKGELVPVDQVDLKFTSNKDCYSSVYYYNEDQYKKFQETGTVSGITDVVTDRVVFDFDSANDLNKARLDALEVVSRLEKMNVRKENLDIYFSGKKGFTVALKLDKFITPEQHKYFALKVVGQGIQTLDESLYNASRILRRPNTKHQDTSFYKIRQTVDQLKSSQCIDRLKDAALKPVPVKDVPPVSLSPVLFELPKQEKKIHVSPSILSDRPKHWKDFKWALAQAIGLEAGERNKAGIIVAATCRGLNYPEDFTRAICTTFDERYAAVTDQDVCPSDVETWVRQVHGPNWNGGMGSIKNNEFLQQYVKRLGIKADDEDAFVSIGEIGEHFQDFSKNFEKNIVRTGIETLDKNSLFLTSTHNGILGQPGSGKTSMILQWLRNVSANEQCSMFYSLDMAKPIVYGKLVQQENDTNMSFEAAIKKYNSDPLWQKVVDANIQERYRNVGWNFKAGASIDQIKDDVKAWEDKHGKKVRLLAIDYLECLQGPYSDQTANTGYISNQMKDLANELSVCSVMLLQTQKHSVSDISDPLTSMKQIKGSSVIEQASSVVVSLWREGYNPSTADQDKFMSFAVVKNRFGQLWQDDFSWNGNNGVISEMSDEDREMLKNLREQKKKAKMDQNTNDKLWT